MLVIKGYLLGWGLMNILIENAESQEFFTTSGIWSKSAAEGKIFRSTMTAFTAAKQEAIGKFNIVCHIPQTNQFVNLDHGKGKGAIVASVA
jgi:hypothetical protein